MQLRTSNMDYHRKCTGSLRLSCLAVVWMVIVCLASGISGQSVPTITFDSAVCTSLDPGYAAAPQTTPASVTITPLSTSYELGGFVSFTIDGAANIADNFRGLIVQARIVGTTTAVGTIFTPSNQALMAVDCEGSSDTLSHTTDDVKPTSLNVAWRAPSTDVGDIEFVGTFINSQQVYWVGVKSAPVYGPSSYCNSVSVICQNGGVCYEDDSNLFRCDCDNTGHTGPTCLVKITTCADAPCLNGALCFSPAVGPGFFCVCTTGWTGDTCETRDNCDPNPCQNGTACSNTADRSDFMCDCGTDFVDKICSVPNYCKSTPCANGRPCTNKADNTGFECDCGTDFLSDTCEIINHCEPNPCQNERPCQNTNDNSGYECICGPLWIGDTCQTENFCSQFPCLNGATCANNADNTGFVCDCTNADGFTGPTCSDPIVPPPCNSDPCLNGGQCAENDDDFVCTCASGWMGVTCAIRDHCFNTPCLNGGTCSNNGAATSFECDCTGTGYRGATCNEREIPPTNPPTTEMVPPTTMAPEGCGNLPPCSTGGRCLGDICICDTGFRGDLCEENINDCAPNPCPAETSTCVDLVNGFSCVCRSGYMGELCDQIVPDGNGGNADGYNLLLDPWWIALICLMVFLVIILVVLAVFTCRSAQTSESKSVAHP